jgi:hypothetical protein
MEKFNIRQNILSIDIDRSEGSEFAIIKIDGRELIEIVKEVELPMAKAAGEASLAGEYSYLPLHLVKTPSNLLLGGDLPLYRAMGDGKRSILECTCGCEGCWPLRAKITAERDLVKWGEFEQPHRKNWIYPDSFEFIFSLDQLEQALKVN